MAATSNSTTGYTTVQVKANLDGSLMVKVWRNETFQFGATLASWMAVFNLIEMAIRGNHDISIYHTDRCSCLTLLADSLRDSGRNVAIV